MTALESLQADPKLKELLATYMAAHRAYHDYWRECFERATRVKS